eukprot:PhF_6_TR35019/c0_g1_i2/m.50972/K13748/MGAT4C; alpha-1,3-mannosylglycoprotein beta-1,4-N-acetylglucosaminyltransferase C
MLIQAYLCVFFVCMGVGTIITTSVLINPSLFTPYGINKYLVPQSTPSSITEEVTNFKNEVLAQIKSLTARPRKSTLSYQDILRSLPEERTLREQINKMKRYVSQAVTAMSGEETEDGEEIHRKNKKNLETLALYAVNTADKMIYQINNFEPLTHAFANPQWNPPKYNTDEHKLNFVIGISSVSRDKDYVVDTVKALFSAMSHQEKGQVKVVLMNGDVPPAKHKAIERTIKRDFGHLIDSGTLIIIKNPSDSGWPQLKHPEKLTVRWQDDTKRILWRSKQVLDVAFLLEQCSELARPESYVLMLEDDVIATMNFVTKIRTFMDEKMYDRVDWTTTSFYNPWPVSDGEELPPYKFFGVIGQIFRPHDLPVIVEFLRKNFDQSPLDWLFWDFLKKFDRKIVVHSPSMFQHVGEISSLSGKTQPSRAVDYEGDMQ